VFTEEMAFVMGGREGKLFKKFEEHCTTAYNLVRKHGVFLINIFLLMLSAGI
jgi:phosphatidylinositol-4,5-bisphosphate 3-kinase